MLNIYCRLSLIARLPSHLQAPGVGHTLLADVYELHGELELPPLRPVGGVHGNQQRVQDALNILRMLLLRHFPASRESIICEALTRCGKIQAATISICFVYPVNVINVFALGFIMKPHLKTTLFKSHNVIIFISSRVSKVKFLFIVFYFQYFSFDYI